MAVWALVKLMREEPGYIPLKYNYKWQNFSHLTREIYRHIAEYQYAGVEGSMRSSVE
jgi:hypothetical protein